MHLFFSKALGLHHKVKRLFRKTHSKMKFRVLIFSILAIFLLNTVGYIPMFKLKEWKLEQKMEIITANTLDTQSLSCIPITSDNQNELLWERPNKEFWYKGQLYDIVRSEKKNGVTYYFCINDTSETELSYQFIENIQKQSENEEDNAPLSNLYEKIIELALPPAYRNTVSIFWVCKDSKSEKVIPYLKYYQSVFYHSIDPPPKGLV